MPIPKNWHRADIVAAIRKRGTNLSALGRANGRADSTLRAALSNPRPPSNRIIAAFLGKTVNEIWPAWFDSEGRPRKPTRTRGCTSSQKHNQQLRLTGGRS
jgi:Ner family transcriptional regulator